MTTTELVSLNFDTPKDARYAVCYGRGATFKVEGKFLRVEKGTRTVVNRALCAVSHFGKRCTICPNRSVTVVLRTPC